MRASRKQTDVQLCNQCHPRIRVRSQERPRTFSSCFSVKSFRLKRRKMRYKHIVIVGASLITTLLSLSGVMYYFNQDKCPVGTFPCQNSSICMPQRSWCNGIMDCPEGDDEFETECGDMHGSWDWFIKDPQNKSKIICDSTQCPEKCTCHACHLMCVGYAEIPQNFSSNVTTITLTNNALTQLSTNELIKYVELRYLYLENNSIRNLADGAFANQRQLQWLILSDNNIREVRRGQLSGLESLDVLRADGNEITYADLFDFENSTSLQWIDFSRNKLTSSTLKLPYLPELKELVLDENRLEAITENLLSMLPSLMSLSLSGNTVTTIHVNAFRNLNNLLELNLEDNKILAIPEDVFKPIGNLTKLSIGFNPIEDLPSALFDPLKNLRSLGLEEIEIVNMEKNIFDLFPYLDFVYLKKFHYCTTYASNVQKCRPVSDGVSSLSHLLSKPLLRAAVWGISCVTCLGNALVLWGRFTAKDENQVLSIVIRNLAVSDMLMGIYLFVIGLEDIRFRDNYNQIASTWMSSWSCTSVGILAMTSSEVSVLILLFMSVERFMLIAAPLKSHRALTPQAASSSMIVIWIFGILLALIPAIHWRSSTRFYGVNGLCFPLHIDNPYLIGWEYSAFIFLGLNLLGLIVIGYVYAGMFASIWRTRHATPLSVGDSEFAVRFFLIVLTDTACWAPIITLKILALMMYPVPSDLHAWVVIFIVPVNSAVNPLLYTFTTPKFRERLGEEWFRKIRDRFTGKNSTRNSHVPTALCNKNVMLSLSSTDEKCPIDHKVSSIPIFINEDQLISKLTQQTNKSPIGSSPVTSQ
ncbi:relaxin receptor 2 isoform X2 [Cephus cinctus]|uniref:Relaxin receptor 2 isoform X2 n=1 Tax=Cephus cinctus TaxID=211228 RepID=A0AAJ7FJB8_CEPCN|nr:relaxin receptor 2 isoform X2 [Cephus cinctus]